MQQTEICIFAVLPSKCNSGSWRKQFYLSEWTFFNMKYLPDKFSIILRGLVKRKDQKKRRRGEGELLHEYK